MGRGSSHARQPEGAAGTVALLPSAAAPHNLPRALTSFIGRDRELQELREALSETRLLTLTGAGGCGKTRLALRVASEALERFPDGVWWVELAPLADEKLVGAAVAEALGVRPLPGLTELQAACAYLASRRALVVLDNCEHLLDAAARAAEAILQAAGEVVVLATSRAPLRVGGETDWRVPSLSLPAAGADGSADGLVGSDAVSLFVERARKVRPRFALSDKNAPSVAEVCADLDGLPLAIELAAARLRMLSVEQIASRVSDRFRLLTDGSRTATTRQQTLRESVDWSHDLLSPDEQVLLRRVAVFTGGFTLEAVEQVCAGDGVDRDHVLDLLEGLVDQSLVIAEEQDVAVRCRLLETVRQYGLERLAEAGEEGALRRRHRDAFLALAEEAAPHLETGRQRHWLDVLDPEAANLTVALEYALHSEPRLALRFCVALARWWIAHGPLAEAERAYARSLEACGDGELAMRARVLQVRAFHATRTADLQAAEVHATEALALAEEAGDERTAARARCVLGSALLAADPRAARTELARAADLARSVGDEWGFVDAMQMTAQAYAFQADHAREAAVNDEVAEAAERLGDRLHVERRWLLVATMAYNDGRFAEARDAAERMRASARGIDAEVWGETLAEAVLGFVDLLQGEPESAIERMNAQLEHALKHGAGIVVPVLLSAIAAAEMSADRPDQARARLEGLVALVRGRDAFGTSWAVGALAEALRTLGDDGAEAAALEAQAIGERIGNRLLVTFPRLTLGRLAAARGEWTVAQLHSLEALDACAEGGHATYVPACLDVLAEVAAGLQAHRDAVRLFAAAERARAEIGVVRIPPEEHHWAGIQSGLREALGDDAYESARAEGAELSLDDALEWARRTRGPRGRPPGGWDSLTPTEAKVAELVSEGLTNPQVGERMFISVETVKTHISHIFRKLDVHSRAELAAYAARRNATLK